VAKAIGERINAEFTQDGFSWLLFDRRRLETPHCGSTVDGRRALNYR
jgi:hypothetical protein